jgi:hypothetical protein
VIKKSLLFIVIFVLAFAGFLIANLPASVAWKYVIAPATKAQSSGVIAKSFDGTLWNGRAYVGFRHLEGVLSWDIGLASVFAGSLPVSIEVDSTAGSIEAVLDVGPTKQQLRVDDLRLQLAKLNPFLRAQRLTIDGELLAKGLSVEVGSRTLEHISGRFSWDGGAVSYPAGREMHDRILPAFSGALSTGADGAIVLGIRDQNASFDTMRGTWSADGDALWEVTRRVLDVAKEPWSANSSETDVVFKVKKPIPRKLGGQ